MVWSQRSTVNVRLTSQQITSTKWTSSLMSLSAELVSSSLSSLVMVCLLVLLSRRAAFHSFTSQLLLVIKPLFLTMIAKFARVKEPVSGSRTSSLPPRMMAQSLFRTPTRTKTWRSLCSMITSHSFVISDANRRATPSNVSLDWIQNRFWQAQLQLFCWLLISSWMEDALISRYSKTLTCQSKLSISLIEHQLPRFLRTLRSKKTKI